MGLLSWLAGESPPVQECSSCVIYAAGCWLWCVPWPAPGVVERPKAGGPPSSKRARDMAIGRVASLVLIALRPIELDVKLLVEPFNGGRAASVGQLAKDMSGAAATKTTAKIRGKVGS